MHLKLKDIKKGQVFYESQYGQDIKMEALEDCRREDGPYVGGFGYVLKVKKISGEAEISEAAECNAYGLRLDTEPQYFRIVI